MSVTVAVTGASGLLGSAMVQSAARRGIDTIGVDRSRISWSSVHQTAEYIRALNADLLVHCAANTNVEGCEQDPSSAYRDNTVLTEIIASACGQSDTQMIYVSSTGVYGDHKEDPYTDFDDVHPTTTHHKSKYLGEQAAQTFCPDALIVRTGWLFGGPADNKKNFVVNRIREARACDGEMVSNREQFGSPTFVTDVAERIFDLRTRGYAGVFNCVNEGVASRFDYVSAIMKASDIDVPIVPKGASAFSRIAPVSNNEAATNTKMGMLGMAPMRDWRVALNDYVSEAIASLG
ncbi:MAG: SDR family oxidoreductase [Pseudomonadota bacterium]